MTQTPEFSASCPIPISDYPQVLLAHGGGGRLMQQLISRMFFSAFANEQLDRAHDGAELEIEGGRIAFTTDSYVVRPLFFPGGDIGSLAINGTVNDLAMCGARPQYLSAGFILEEGLPMETLWKLVQSMRAAAQVAGVRIVTGDTKVVDRGKGDGIYLNTAGVGRLAGGHGIAPSQVRAGDAVILNGDLGRHGMAIMSVREGLEFESPIESDCAPLVDQVFALLDAGIEVHCLRDLTRGGLSSGLNEIAASARVGIEVEELAIPIREEVRGACEMLGLDPLYVANEGRFVAFVRGDQAEEAVRVLSRVPEVESACCIGRVAEGNAGLVTLKSRIGAHRLLDLLSGEQLPRIC